MNSHPNQLYSTGADKHQYIIYCNELDDINYLTGTILNNLPLFVPL